MGIRSRSRRAAVLSAASSSPTDGGAAPPLPSSTSDWPPLPPSSSWRPRKNINFLVEDSGPHHSSWRSRQPLPFINAVVGRRWNLNSIDDFPLLLQSKEPPSRSVERVPPPPEFVPGSPLPASLPCAPPEFVPGSPLPADQDPTPIRYKKDKKVLALFFKTKDQAQPIKSFEELDQVMRKLEFSPIFGESRQYSKRAWDYSTKALPLPTLPSSKVVGLARYLYDNFVAAVDGYFKSSKESKSKKNFAIRCLHVDMD